MNLFGSDRETPPDAAALNAGQPTHAKGPSEESERWMRAAMHNSSDFVMILEADATIRYVSSAVERVLGYRPKDFVGTLALDYVHPEDLEYMSKSFAETLKKPGVQPPIEFKVRAANGSWRYMEAIRSNWLEDPNVAGLVANVRDVTERKEAEEHFRFQARLLDTVGEAVIALDMNQKVVYWNQAAEGMYGWSSEEVMGRRLREMVVPEDSREQAEEISKQVKETGHWSGEFVVRRKDGTSFPVMASNTPLQDGTGNVVGVISVLRDVTKRKKAKERLREAEERYRTLVEQVPAVIYINPSDGSNLTLYISPQIEAMLDYTPKEWMETDLWAERIHPDDVLWVLAANDRSRESGERLAAEYRLLAKDGSVIWVRDEAALLRDEAGEPLFWQGVMVNTTERKRIEQEFRELSQQNELILNSAGEGILGVDPEGRITFANPTAATILGWKVEELIGRHGHLTMHHTKPDGTPYPREECPIHASIKDGIRRGVKDEVFWRKDGTSFFVEYTCTLIERDEEVVGAVLTFSDITERKLTDKALRESEERYRSLVELFSRCDTRSQ